jgi:hypothetical protein
MGALLFLTTGDLAAAQASRVAAEFEGGAVWQSRNNVQIPNDSTGTRFALVDTVGKGPWTAFRFNMSWNISGRHSLRFLVAPLSYTDSGTFDSPIRFAGRHFAPDQPVSATYQFDSWRFGYRYRFYSGDRWTWWVGATGKLRDAKIRIEQGNTASEDNNLGFVPLVYLHGDWRFRECWRLILDVDALAGGPGRAADASFKIGYDAGDHWGISTGYRLLEGGADVDDVYNFAWFHYAVTSLEYRF